MVNRWFGSWNNYQRLFFRMTASNLVLGIEFLKVRLLFEFLWCLAVIETSLGHILLFFQFHHDIELAQLRDSLRNIASSKPQRLIHHWRNVIHVVQLVQFFSFSVRREYMQRIFPFDSDVSRFVRLRCAILCGHEQVLSLHDFIKICVLLLFIVRY